MASIMADYRLRTSQKTLAAIYRHVAGTEKVASKIKYSELLGLLLLKP